MLVNQYAYEIEVINAFNVFTVNTQFWIQTADILVMGMKYHIFCLFNIKNKTVDGKPITNLLQFIIDFNVLVYGLLCECVFDRREYRGVIRIKYKIKQRAALR